MTTLQQIQLRCPLCETRFQSHVVLAKGPVARKSTDFREHFAGTNTLPFQVHSCARCGYAGSLDAFGEEAAVDPLHRAQLLAELAPASPTPKAPVHPPTSTLLGSEKYEAALRVAEWQDAEPRRLADLSLRAAWCCVDEGDVEGERYFRRRAAREFEQALASWDGVPREERPILTYLVGELWRRVGDIRQANEWFEEVPGEVVDFQAHQWVIDLMRQQRDNPREWLG
jgi:uncharacterized protein (DUF2225 family)